MNFSGILFIFTLCSTPFAYNVSSEYFAFAAEPDKGGLPDQRIEEEDHDSKPFCTGKLWYKFEFEPKNHSIKNSRLTNGAFHCEGNGSLPNVAYCITSRVINDDIFTEHAVDVSCYEEYDLNDTRCSGDPLCYMQYGYNKHTNKSELFQQCCCFVDNCFATDLFFLSINLITMGLLLGPTVICFIKFFEQFPSSKVSLRLLLKKRTKLDQVLSKLRSSGTDPFLLTFTRRIDVSEMMAKKKQCKIYEMNRGKNEQDRFERRIRHHYRIGKLNRMTTKLHLLKKSEIDLYKEHEQDRLRILQYIDGKKEEASREQTSKVDTPENPEKMESNVQKAPTPGKQETESPKPQKNEDDDAKTPPN
uniref:Uncharacterized protein n=1 Tax=Panagrolaimus sp. JU765 TaxID=591449 RepID=A0AC34PWR8_9BILA